MKLPEGLYERVLDSGLRKVLGQEHSEATDVETRKLQADESPSVLSDHFSKVLHAILQTIHGDNGVQRQVELLNSILNSLPIEVLSRNLSPELGTLEDELLLSLYRTKGQGPDHRRVRPDTPLSTACLLTGTRRDPSLVSQLRKEILSSDRIDILCSFIKWAGVRTIAEELRQFTANPNSQLRVITTSYIGATDLKAIEFLNSLPRTEVKITYDTHRTRLHAKAYQFHRATGFGGAYIGSANLSHAALTEGLEWIVKISEYQTQLLWRKVTASFESYWHDPEFVSYDRSQRSRLASALQSERGDHGDKSPAVFFDIVPWGYQKEILETLAAERETQGRTRQLVVAATGTGKTVIAAFDFRQFSRTFQSRTGRFPRLAYIAHRREILTQSLQTFRAVLRDQNFGDVLTGEDVPQSVDQLFVSIQSYNSRQLWSGLAPDYYDYVVIDEFHHAAAPSYRQLLDFIQPKLLLGLTATPERHDELDVLHHFDHHVSAEIRLPDAVNRKLLVPFQYFGCADSVDLSGLRWERGGYDVRDLEQAYVGNRTRNQLVVQKIFELLLDPDRAKALCFCVSVAHAKHVAAVLSEYGLKSAVLTGETASDVRADIQGQLRRSEINFLCVVDLYNEGVDIPEVDTVVFLRPTESLTVFLQQLGRGLRHFEGKDCLTVLDFVGQAHNNFRFDLRFRALSGEPRLSLETQIAGGFPHLPAGCSIHLERLAQARILKNIRQSILGGQRSLIRAIAEFHRDSKATPSLGTFLQFHKIEVGEVYRRRSWSRLCVLAGCHSDFKEADEAKLENGLHRVCHIDDPNRLIEIGKWLTHDWRPDWEGVGDYQRRVLLMFHYALWGTLAHSMTPQEGIGRLSRNPVMRSELVELITYLASTAITPGTSDWTTGPIPLRVHCHYIRDEVLAALGHWTIEDQPEVREGVLYIPSIPADVLFVTLLKSEREFSPTTMYEDYAIDERLFHWQSQNTTSEDSPTGLRYREHVSRTSQVLLFVREQKQKGRLAAPYTFLGPCRYASHTGSRPMSIIWELLYPMPASFLRRALPTAAA